MDKLTLTPRLIVKRYIIDGKVRRLPPLKPNPKFRVDVRFNPRDFLVCLLGSFGFSTACIAARTNLSEGQVLYRLRKGSVERKDYRNGQSDFAKLMLQRTADSAAPLLEQKFRTLRLPSVVAA